MFWVEERVQKDCFEQDNVHLCGQGMLPVIPVNKDQASATAAPPRLLMVRPKGNSG